MEISCVLSSGYQLRKKRSNGCNNPKLPIGREPEFRDMNQFSEIGIVSLEFRVSPEVGVI